MAVHQGLEPCARWVRILWHHPNGPNYVLIYTVSVFFFEEVTHLKPKHHETGDAQNSEHGIDQHQYGYHSWNHGQKVKIRELGRRRGRTLIWVIK